MDKRRKSGVSNQVNRRKKEQEVARYARSYHIPYRGKNTVKRYSGLLSPAYGSPPPFGVKRGCAAHLTVQFISHCPPLRYGLNSGLHLALVGLPTLCVPLKEGALHGPFTSSSPWFGFAPLQQKPRIEKQQWKTLIRPIIEEKVVYLWCRLG